MVVNPVRGLLDRTRSEEHLQSYNESIKTKQNKGRNYHAGHPFKCHEEVLYLQPMIPPKRFDIFLTWGAQKV